MAKQILGKVLPVAKGEYSSSTQYEILDIVTYNGSSYIAKTSVRGQVPTNTTYWQLLAKQGDKPVYKVDYLTDTEMQAIVNEIIEDSTNAFNQNVVSKTNQFDSNASTKTTSFNNNATSKTSDFNSNASSKTTNFNQNASDKTTAFNTNAQSKQDDFNTNATAATGDYNSNALAKTNAFNDNATAKQGAYDSNHTTKLGAYNDNAASKTTTFNENASDKTDDFNDNYQDKLDEFNEYAGSFDTRIKNNSDRIYHIENDLFDSGNASGSNITLNDSTLAEFKEVREDGVCKQTTTTGKNIFDKDSAVYKNGYIKDDNGNEAVSSGNVSGYITNYIALKPNTQYTIQGDIASSSSSMRIYYYDVSKQWLSRSRTILQSEIPYTFTTSSDCYYMQFQYVVASINPSTIQIEEGSSATSYEPYTGGEPSPSPDYPQSISVLTGTHHINVCGKNIFDGELELGTYDNNGNKINYDTVYRNKNIIKVEPNKTYTFSINGVAQNYVVYYYDMNKTYINNNSLLSSGIFTVPNNIYYINFRSFSTDFVNNFANLKVQLEVGLQATTYEPYVGTSTEITIPQGEFAGKVNDTYKDQIRIAFNETDGEYHAYLDKKIGKDVLDGSENWQGYSDLGTNVKAYFTKDNIATRSAGYCNYFKVITTETWNTDETGIMFTPISTSLIALKIPKTVLSTQDIAGIKAWLSTHNTEAYYLTKTSYTIDLGVIDMPLSYYPITNITTDSDLQPLLNVDYYRDFKATISTMQNAIESLDARVTALEEA